MSVSPALPMPTLSPTRAFPPLDPSVDPEFDPGIHLALEHPEQIFSLADLGYEMATIAAAPSPVAATSCFRVLSDAGVAALQGVVEALEPYCRNLQRISRAVCGGVYQSRFLRGLCLNKEVAAHCSQLMDLELHPHSLPHQLGHLNYTPKTPGENIDKWHVDTLRFDYVLFVTDPKDVAGGEFQYFKGTAREMAALATSGAPFPEDRIVSPAMPGPGYAVLQQGNMVVHRAKGLDHSVMNKAEYSGLERITMVNGYVPADVSYPDYTAFEQLYRIDPPDVIAGEYARHIAWMAEQHLKAMLAHQPGSQDKSSLSKQLASIAQQLNQAAEDLSSAQAGNLNHFGDGV